MSSGGPMEKKRAGWGGRLALLAAAVLLILMARAIWLQRQEDALMRTTAAAIVRDAGAVTTEEKVQALRAYIREHVTWRGATLARTSFLRDTATQTLKSGKGYCGENSRLFILLARAVGIPSQRVNLYGRKNHVVAEVDLDGRRVVVDCQNPGYVPEMVPVDTVIGERRFGFKDASTIHVGRFLIGRLVQRIVLRIGPWSWWLESPYAIMVGVYGFLLTLLLLGWIFSRLFRAWVQRAARALPAAPPAAFSARSEATA